MEGGVGGVRDGLVCCVVVREGGGGIVCSRRSW